MKKRIIKGFADKRRALCEFKEHRKCFWGTRIQYRERVKGCMKDRTKEVDSTQEQDEKDRERVTIAIPYLRRFSEYVRMIFWARNKYSWHVFWDSLMYSSLTFIPQCSSSGDSCKRTLGNPSLSESPIRGRNQSNESSNNVDWTRSVRKNQS